jgi:2-C-methyl-D-erythritol 4-phosphate cytidylyltransferase
MEPDIAATTGTTAAIIPAGGMGQRFSSGRPKQFVELAGWPVLAHTLNRFDQTDAVDQVVVVAPYDLVTDVRRGLIETSGFVKPFVVVAGGETRQESVYQGFMALDEEVDLVVVHDGVRPLVRVSTIEAVVEAARKHNAAIAAVPVRDTLKRVEDGVIQDTLDRTAIYQAQTPQAFSRLLLAAALAEAKKAGFVGTDEAALIERLGQAVHVVIGAPENIKITMPEDLVLAEAIIRMSEDDLPHADRFRV